MEWRCTWCGKPHEDNDPPCDNCGHGRFERAVVQRPTLAEDGPDVTTMWVCTECGRAHPKHSPPCSRCGAATLERREQSVADAELAAPGYLDLLTPRYLAALLVTVLLAAVFLIGFTGIAEVPGFPGTDVPQVEGVPGNESTYQGMSLAAVETAYLDEQRALLEPGGEQLIRDETLDEVARYLNQEYVRASAAGEDTTPDADPVQAPLAEVCGDSVQVVVLSVTVDDGATADSISRTLVERFEAEYVDTGRFDTTLHGFTGVDAHVGPDGELSLWQLACEG